MLASLAFALWPTHVSDNCPLTENTQIVGIAYDSKNQLLYCERVLQLGEDQLHIDYILDNKIFATKDLKFITTPEKPQVLQKDLRSGEVREAIVTKAKIQLKYKESAEKQEKSNTIADTEIDVVDAGFNEFIRHNWQSLQEKTYTPLRFGSIAHLKTLDLRVGQQDITKCISKNTSQKSDTCFVVEIDNFLLRILLGKMQLIYDDQHRLKNYLGPVNIANDKGDTQNASIDYYYSENYLDTKN